MEASVPTPLGLAGWLRGPLGAWGCGRPVQGREQGGRSPSLWRPWLPTAKDLCRQNRDQTDPACGSEMLVDGGSGKASALFRHPVRLFWPRSKSFDYLYSEGEKLLENFPVQATISLYEDSDSEEEEEEEGWGEEGQVEEWGQQAEESVLQQEAGCHQGPAGVSQPIKLCLK
ncbi:protein ripply1 [Chrysemys picta bellii]|uniref:protein ripply1 n=1 Tax=Chrysemys picta bellii TaxID=8478 RepID=UPI000CE65760|nr:protein ripply1 [Chrysemys picta bellii]XP_042717468.1 protein ripply1 [Chrysemys picta bellii]